MYKHVCTFFGLQSVGTRALSNAELAGVTGEATNAECLTRASKLLPPCSSRFELLGVLAYLRDFSDDPRVSKLRSSLNEDEIEDVLKRLHRSCFVAWLTISLSQQVADIKLYLQDPENARLSLNLLAVAGRMAVPHEARREEAALFKHQLESIQLLFGSSATNVSSPAAP